MDVVLLNCTLILREKNNGFCFVYCVDPSTNYYFTVMGLQTVPPAFQDERKDSISYLVQIHPNAYIFWCCDFHFESKEFNYNQKRNIIKLFRYFILGYNFSFQTDAVFPGPECPQARIGKGLLKLRGICLESFIFISEFGWKTIWCFWSLLLF